MIPSYLVNRGWNSEKLWCTCVAVTCRATALEMRAKLVSLPARVLLNLHNQLQQAYEFKKDREGRQRTYEHRKQVTASTWGNFASANVNYFYDDFVSIVAICSKVCTSHLGPDCLALFKLPDGLNETTLKRPQRFHPRHQTVPPTQSTSMAHLRQWQGHTCWANHLLAA